MTVNKEFRPNYRDLLFIDHSVVLIAILSEIVIAGNFVVQNAVEDS